MQFINTGSPNTERVSFNSGTINFGNNLSVDLDSITFNFKLSSVPMYILNTVIMQKIARGSQTVSMEGTSNSWSPEMETIAWGSQSSGSPASRIDPIAGQPTLADPVFTLYDMSQNEVQIQTIDTLFTSDVWITTSQGWTKWTFSMEARTAILLYE